MSIISRIKVPNDSTEYYVRDKYALNQFEGGVAGVSGTNTAGLHNSLYRGWDLGNTITSDQIATIAAGEFENLYVGDFWASSSTYFVIAAFDYFYGRGDVANDNVVSDHHVVLLIWDEYMFSTYKCKMNSSNSSAGGYQSAKARGNSPYIGFGLDTILNTFEGWVGSSSHTLTWWDSWPNTVVNGQPSAGAWYSSKCDLMTEQQVFGWKPLGPMNTGTTSVWNYTLSCTQFPLFRYWPPAIRLVPNRDWGTTAFPDATHYWLRDVADSARFVSIDNNGRANKYNASNQNGVVGYVCLK